MNATQIQLVQASFEHVKPIAGVAAELFYNRLFELDPALRALFKGDLNDQQVKLMATLAIMLTRRNASISRAWCSTPTVTPAATATTGTPWSLTIRPMCGSPGRIVSRPAW